jgi:3-phosphoshikimate 1-carboxyvinyltransferase
LSAPLTEMSVTLPGDLDASLMLLASAMAMEGSHVGLRHVVAQPSDAAALSVIRDGGGALTVQARSTVAGQAIADLAGGSGRPQVVSIDGERAAAAGASLPTLAAWGAFARSDSVIAGISPASTHPDQGRRVSLMLAQFGVPAHWSEQTRTLRVTGNALRRAAEGSRTVETAGDGSSAMLAAVLGLASGGTTRIRDANCIVARFPRFVGSLRALGANLSVEP